MKNAEIHALSVILVPRTPNAEYHSIVHCATVYKAGVVIHIPNVTNVSWSSECHYKCCKRKVPVPYYCIFQKHRL